MSDWLVKIEFASARTITYHGKPMQVERYKWVMAVGDMEDDARQHATDWRPKSKIKEVLRLSNTPTES